MTATDEDKLLPLLRKVAFLEPLDEGALREFARLVRSEWILTGTLLFREGSPAESLFVVMNGAIEIVKGLGEAEPRVLATLGPGDFFGEMGIFERSPRQASARCSSSGALGRVSRDELLLFVASRPAVDMKIRRTMARRHTENVAAAFRK